MSNKFRKFANLYYLAKSNKKASNIILIILAVLFIVFLAVVYLIYSFGSIIIQKINQGLPALSDTVKGLSVNFGEIGTLFTSVSDWVLGIVTKFKPLFDLMGNM
jgi:hypothetical protein